MKRTHMAPSPSCDEIFMRFLDGTYSLIRSATGLTLYIVSFHGRGRTPALPERILLSLIIAQKPCPQEEIGQLQNRSRSRSYIGERRSGEHLAGSRDFGVRKDA